jgi:UrcA family protein
MTRLTNLARASVLLALASSALALTPAAFAAADDDLPQARLNITGTDLTSAKSVAHLKSRVRHTAFDICAPDWDGKSLMSMDQRKCYDTALQNGMAQIESKRLEALRKTSPDMASAQPREQHAH